MCASVHHFLCSFLPLTHPHCLNRMCSALQTISKGRTHIHQQVYIRRLEQVKTHYLHASQAQTRAESAALDLSLSISHWILSHTVSQPHDIMRQTYWLSAFSYLIPTAVPHFLCFHLWCGLCTDRLVSF